MIMPQSEHSEKEIAQAMINDLKEIRRINAKLMKDGPDTAAAACKMLCDKVLDAIKRLGIGS